jgi:hypothetical protein
MVDIILIYTFLCLLDDMINLKLILHLLKEISTALLFHVLFIYHFEDFASSIYGSEMLTVFVLMELFDKLVGVTFFIGFEKGASLFHTFLYAFFVTSFLQIIVVLQGSRMLSKVIIIHRLRVC